MKNYKNFIQKYYTKNNFFNKKLGLINKLAFNLKKNSYKQKLKNKVSKNNFYLKNIFRNLKKFNILKEQKDLKKNLFSYKELICSFLILKGKSKMFQHIAQKSFENMSKKYPQLNLYFIIKNFFSFYSLPITYINKSNKKFKWKKNNYKVQWLNTSKERQTIFNFFKDFLKKQLKRNLKKNFQPIFLSLSSSKTELLKIQVENIKKNVNLWKTLSSDFRLYQKQIKSNFKNNNNINLYPNIITYNKSESFNIKCLYFKNDLKSKNFNQINNFILKKNGMKFNLNRKEYFNRISKYSFKTNNKTFYITKYLQKKNNFQFLLKKDQNISNILSIKQKMKLYISFYKKIANFSKIKKKQYLKKYLSKKFFWKKRKNFKLINIFFNKILLIFKNFIKPINFILNKNDTLFNLNKKFFIQKKNVFDNSLENEEKIYWRNFIGNKHKTISNLKGRSFLIKKTIPNYIFYLHKTKILYWKKNFSFNFGFYSKFNKQFWNKTFFLLKKKKTTTFFFNKIPVFKNILKLQNNTHLFISKHQNINLRLLMFSKIKLCQGIKLEFKVWDKKEYIFLNNHLEKKLYSFFNKNNLLIISNPLKVQKTRRTVLTSPHANKNGQQHLEKTIYNKTYKIFFLSENYKNNYYYYFNFMKHLLENDFKNYGISISLISSKI
jgi:hypothetical protein